MFQISVLRVLTCFRCLPLLILCILSLEWLLLERCMLSRMALQLQLLVYSNSYRQCHHGIAQQNLILSIVFYWQCQYYEWTTHYIAISWLAFNHRTWHDTPSCTKMLLPSGKKMRISEAIWITQEISLRKCLHLTSWYGGWYFHHSAHMVTRIVLVLVNADHKWV